MNRERLSILRDHLASLPDEQVDMSVCKTERDCGTVACIGGWAGVLFAPDGHEYTPYWRVTLGITERQSDRLFMPIGWLQGCLTRSDAIAAIQSMLDSPDDDALPVWPDSNITGAGK